MQRVGVPEDKLQSLVASVSKRIADLYLTKVSTEVYQKQLKSVFTDSAFTQPEGKADPQLSAFAKEMDAAIAKVDVKEEGWLDDIGDTFKYPQAVN